MRSVRKGISLRARPRFPKRRTRETSGGGSKSLLEILIAPLALTLVTAIVGYFAASINQKAQEAANERALQAAQIAAVAEISAGSANSPANSPDAEGVAEQQGIRLFIARLALYGEQAVPILLALLQDEESVQALSPQERTVVERNLIQIALRGHPDAVGQPMLEVLDDPWKMYGSQTHGSALRILSRICYPGFAEAFARYAPEGRIEKRDWESLMSHPEEFEEFGRTLAVAGVRAMSPTCGAKPREKPGLAWLRW